MNFCGIFGWCISVGGGMIEWISGFLRWKCRNDCHCHTILVHTCTTTGCSTCNNARAAHKNLIVWNRWYRLFESLRSLCVVWCSICDVHDECTRHHRRRTSAVGASRLPCPAASPRRPRRVQLDGVSGQFIYTLHYCSSREMTYFQMSLQSPSMLLHC